MIDLAEVLTGNVFAGITGLIGGVAQKYVDYKSKKLDYAHSLKMTEFEIRSQELEQKHELAIADKQVERAKIEGDLAVTNAEVNAFRSSYDYAKTETEWLRWVRPAITTYILIWATVLSIVAWRHNSGISNFDSMELKDMIVTIIETVMYLLVLSVSWWFGSRGGNIVNNKKR